VVTLAEDVGFNSAGARNTGVLAAPTEVVALFDLSRAPPTDPRDLDAMFKAALSITAGGNFSHLYQVAASDADVQVAPNQALVHRGFFLHTRGLDEDFASGYGYDGLHFLHRFVNLHGGLILPLRLPSVAAVEAASPSDAMDPALLSVLTAQNAVLMHTKNTQRLPPASFCRVAWSVAPVAV
jgi:hypothetical protein